MTLPDDVCKVTYELVEKHTVHGVGCSDDGFICDPPLTPKLTLRQSLRPYSFGSLGFFGNSKFLSKLQVLCWLFYEITAGHTHVFFYET